MALTLVVGGTGKTGRRIVERLRDQDVPVRIASRPTFDWAAPETWPGTLDGVHAAYLAYAPDLAVPGAPETVGAFAELAATSGVRRLVLLSGRGEEEARQTEKLVQDAGAEWTILRAAWFNQNFSESYLLDPVREGELVLPAGPVPEPFVDVEDIAEVAVAALTEDGHVGQTYELTGPRLLTFADAVAEISAATGRAIRFRQVSNDDYAAAMSAAGVPEDVIWLLRYLFGTVLDGRNANVGDGVQRALGRPPRDFADFARRTAETGLWQ